MKCLMALTGVCVAMAAGCLVSEGLQSPPSRTSALKSVLTALQVWPQAAQQQQQAPSSSPSVNSSSDQSPSSSWPALPQPAASPKVPSSVPPAAQHLQQPEPNRAGATGHDRGSHGARGSPAARRSKGQAGAPSPAGQRSTALGTAQQVGTPVPA